MSNRTTAEIVADLRHPFTRLDACDEAADRLQLLQGELYRLSALLTELDILRPPCPVCDGSQSLGVRHDGLPCPDCVDGKVSIAQLAATWRRVWAFGPTEQHTHGGEYGDGWRACIDHLREVTP